MEQNDAEKIIDYWSIPKFEETDNPHPLLETSTFSFVFPKYREEYFKSDWQNIKSILRGHGLSCDINYLEGKVSVSTTKDTWDPYIVIKGRDFLRLLARSVPFEKAKTILSDGVFCEIMKLNTKRLSKERFAKRRARLIGTDGNTLKALQLLCDCYIHIQGNTAAIIGSVYSIKQIQKVIEETMSNINPLYNIKAMLVKKELLGKEEVASQDWKNLIPKFKPQRIKSKVLKYKKKSSGALPPPPIPRKIDKELETGEYFLKQKERMMIKKQKKKAIQQEKSQIKQSKKQKDFEPPEEKPFPSYSSTKPTYSIEKLKQNLQTKRK